MFKFCLQRARGKLLFLRQSRKATALLTIFNFDKMIANDNGDLFSVCKHKQHSEGAAHRYTFFEILFIIDFYEPTCATLALSTQILHFSGAICIRVCMFLSVFFSRFILTHSFFCVHISNARSSWRIVKIQSNLIKTRIKSSIQSAKDASILDVFV